MMNKKDVSTFKLGDIVLCHRGRNLQGTLRVAIIVGQKQKNGYMPTVTAGYTKNGNFKRCDFPKSFGSMERENDISLFKHSQLH
jgi:hypothetical protein